MSPNVYNVSYTHAAGSGQSAGRAATYITRRPEEGQEPTRESQWREIESIGDRDEFVEEANRRRDEKREQAEQRGKDLSKDKSPGAAQYNHIVISPERGEEMADEDFHRIAQEWSRDEYGEEHPHVGAIHRDGDGHDHMHLLVARDKLGKEELEERKEASEEAVRDIERFRGIDRDQDRERASERGQDRDQGVDGGQDHQPEQGVEMER